MIWEDRIPGQKHVSSSTRQQHFITTEGILDTLKELVGYIQAN
jgi:hypothetical protein